MVDWVDYTSLEFEVHNGYLAEKKSRTNFGRFYDQLKIVTSRGKQIMVRRYDDEGGEFPTLLLDHIQGRICYLHPRFSYLVEFEILSDGYWLEQKDVQLWERGKFFVSTFIAWDLRSESFSNSLAEVGLGRSNRIRTLNFKFHRDLKTPQSKQILLFLFQISRRYAPRESTCLVRL